MTILAEFIVSLALGQLSGPLAPAWCVSSESSGSITAEALAAPVQLRFTPPPPFPASRSSIRSDYNYIQLTAGTLKNEGPATDSDIVSFQGEFRLADALFLRTKVDLLDIESEEGTRDLSEFSLGLGTRAAILSWVDLVGTLSYLDTLGETTGEATGGRRISRFGYSASAGIRMFAPQALELSAFFEYFNLESGREDKELTLGATLYTGEKLGLQVHHTRTDLNRSLMFGLRLYL